METSSNPVVDSPPRLARNRSYMLLMSGLTAEALGAGMAAFAVPLLALAITGSAWQAGVVAAVGNVGGLLATLPAGVVADRVDRRRLIMISATIAALAWGSAAVAGLAGHLTAVHLAAVLLTASVAGSFVEPSVSGALRSVVPTEQLPTAYAATQGRDAVATLLSGPVGGVLYGVAHAVPLIAGAVGHLCTAVCAGLVREPLNGDLADARRTRPVAALREGLAYVWSVPVFRICLGLFALINAVLSGVIIAVTLSLADGGTPAARIGLLTGVVGASMLGGALLAPRLVQQVRVGILMPVALAAVAIAVLTMAAVQDFVVYVVALGLGALLVPAANAAMAGYAAAITPPQLQGRFSSVMDLSVSAALPVAPLVGGGLLEAFGIGVTLVVLAGVLAAVVVAVWCAPPVRRIGRPETWADDVVDPAPAPAGP